MLVITGPISIALSFAAIAILLRICWTDFFFLKIWNSDLLILLGITVPFLLVTWPENILLRLGFGLILFSLSFVFWMSGALGAGDVKLFGIVGFLIDPRLALLFIGLILGFVIVVFVIYQRARVLKFVPQLAGRQALQLMDTGRIPYGVPIALATISLMTASLVGRT